MPEAKDEISELLELQRAAAKNKARSQKDRAKKSATEAAIDDAKEAAAEVEDKLRGISGNFLEILEEIENTTKEHPVLVTAGAFVLGVAAAQLFSRR